QLVMMEGRPRGMDLAMDLRSFAVYNIDAALLLVALLVIRSLCNVLRSRMIGRQPGGHIEYGAILVGSADFINRILHLLTVTFLFIFYQCAFNGNFVADSGRLSSAFESVVADLMNGTRRLLIDTGVLMENEYTSFGPLTTVMTDEQERLTRLCTANDDVVLLWDDQMFRLPSLNASIARECRLNRYTHRKDSEKH
ncbi:hypothetical protein PFISCL1PPCAC_12863, partial [Pristionchus fissidentatus]